MEAPRRNHEGLLEKREGRAADPGHTPVLPSNPSTSPWAVILNSFFLSPVPPACDSPCASCIYLSDSFLITRH